MSPTFSSPDNISPDAVFAHAPFLKAFFIHLPYALHALLKKDGESLERLQLVAMTLIKKSPFSDNIYSGTLGPVTIRRLTDGDLFLSLDFSIFEGGIEKVSCELTYFVRGQKKFFRPEVPLFEQKPIASFGFNKEYIGAFFTYLHQENAMFLNDDLVGLARTTLVVPSQIVAFYLLGLWAKDAHFKLVFFNEVKPDEIFFIHNIVDGRGVILLNKEAIPIACIYNFNEQEVFSKS